MGAGGLILVDDDEEAALSLSRTYGVDDIPLVLTSRRFNDDHTIDTEAVYGDVMLTNGTPAAYTALPAGVVRLRILNAEIERSYNLGCEDGRTNTTFDVLRVTVGTPADGGVDSIPDTLAPAQLGSASDATVARTIAITDDGPGTPFSFDGQPYDEDVVNQVVHLGDTEMWTIKNNQTFGHAFHIHDVQFSIVSRSDGAVADYERGWKDTVFVPLGESVAFVASFEDFASATDPYRYHCHMANHEDGGRMGQFLVE